MNPRSLRRLMMALVGIGAFGLALTAFAEERSSADLVVPIGMSVEVGGGVQTFLDGDATDVTHTAGMWTARLIVGTRSYLGAEAAYFGSAQAIDAAGLDRNAILVSNGLEGLVRVNALAGVLQPYAVGGVAWRQYSLRNTAVNTSSILDRDDLAEIPVGIGIAYRFGNNLILDLRGMYRHAFGQRLIPGANLSSIGGDLKLGWEF